MGNVLFEVTPVPGKPPAERAAAPGAAASAPSPAYAGAWRKGRRSSVAPDADTATCTLTTSASAATITEQPTAATHSIGLHSGNKIRLQTYDVFANV